MRTESLTLYIQFNEQQIAGFKLNPAICIWNYVYLLDGNQSRKTNKNGKITTYVYDPIGRLKKETDPDWNTISYEYDTLSNRSKMTVTGAESYETAYEYGTNNWLELETKTLKDGAIEKYFYRYDANGNQMVRRLEKTSPKKGSTPGKVYVEKGDQKDGDIWLELREFDGFGQMIKITQDSAETRYRYRPDGLRYSKEGRNPFAGTKSITVHIWDGPEIIAECGANGAIHSRFIRGLNLIARVQDGQRQYYLFNAHGDVIERTSANGTTLKNYDYDAFGVEKTPEKLDVNPFRYCGEYYDKETETYYLRARYYYPRLGQFSQEDPARSGLNWYTYCGGDPIQFVDPSGCIAKDQLEDFLGQFALEALKITSRNMGGSIFDIPDKLDQIKGTYDFIKAVAAGEVSIEDILSGIWDGLSGDTRFVFSNLDWFKPGTELTDGQVTELAQRTAGAWEEIAGVAVAAGTAAKQIVNKVAAIKPKTLLQSETKAGALESIQNLPIEAQGTIKRFFKGGSSSYHSFIVSKTAKGNFIASMTKPGNIPGSYAVYTKTINSMGNTVSMIQTAYDKYGKLVHYHVK